MSVSTFKKLFGIHKAGIRDVKTLATLAYVKEHPHCTHRELNEGMQYVDTQCSLSAMKSRMQGFAMRGWVNVEKGDDYIVHYTLSEKGEKVMEILSTL